VASSGLCVTLGSMLTHVRRVYYALVSLCASLTDPSGRSAAPLWVLVAANPVHAFAAGRVGVGYYRPVRPVSVCAVARGLVTFSSGL